MERPRHTLSTRTTQEQLAICWGLLKAGCEFRVIEQSNCTINLEIEHPTFSTIEWGEGELEQSSFYLPTQNRLDLCKGNDWY
jgi:hypothetical protein